MKHVYILFIALVVSNGCAAQKVYKNKFGETISLEKDSIIKFELNRPSILCTANYYLDNNKVNVQVDEYKVMIDTLYDESCEGFYIEGADAYLKCNDEIISPDAVNPYFFRVPVDSARVEVVFRNDELESYIMNNVSKGCYLIKFDFSQCSFIEKTFFDSIRLKNRGKVMIFNNQKFFLTK